MNASADTMTNTTARTAVHSTAPMTSEEKPAKLPLHLRPSSFTSHLFFGPYIFIPLVTSLAWFCGILSLIAIWARDGKPKYAPKEASIVFVSNVAGKHKNVFIPMAAITAGGFVLSLLAERWLRHLDRLPGDKRRREAIFHWLAIFFAAGAGSGLIALAVCDNFNHSRVHWSMTALFIICTALSAVFQTGEVWSLHKDHPDRKSLLRNSIFKVIVIILAVGGAIAFAALYGVCKGSSVARGNRTAQQCNRITSAAAAVEWAIAFLLTFFFLTLVADLWPAGKSSPRYMARLARWQEKHEPQGLKHDYTGRRAFHDPTALNRLHSFEAEPQVGQHRVV